MGTIHERTAVVEDLQREACIGERVIQANRVDATTNRPTQASLERRYRG